MHLRLVKSSPVAATETTLADRIEREVRGAIDRFEALANEADECGELLDELAIRRLKDELDDAFALLVAVSE